MSNKEFCSPELLIYLKHANSIYAKHGYQSAKEYLSTNKSFHEFMKKYARYVNIYYEQEKFNELSEALQENFSIGFHCQESNLILGNLFAKNRDHPNSIKYYLAACRSAPIIDEASISQLYLYIAISYCRLKDEINSSLHLANCIKNYAGKFNIARVIEKIKFRNEEKSIDFMRSALLKQIKFNCDKCESMAKLAAILAKENDLLAAQRLYLSLIKSNEYKALAAQKLLEISTNFSDQEKGLLEKILIENQSLFYSFTISNPVKTLDKGTSKKSFITADQILPLDGMRFIPSVMNPSSSPIRHFLHVHLSKTGGTFFTDPIWQAIKLWYLENEFMSHWECLSDNHIELNNGLQFLAEDGLIYSSGIEIEDLIRLVGNSKKFLNLDFSYLRTHLYNHHLIWNSLKDTFDIEMIRIGLYRDPVKRLESALNQLYNGSANRSIDKLIYYIRSKHIPCRSSTILNNPIYRGVMSNYANDSTWVNSHATEPQIDYLVPISDSSMIASLQSSIISQFGLPNILHSSRIHSRPVHSCIKRELMDDLLDECSRAGLGEFDNLSFLKNLSQMPVPDSLLNSQDSVNNFIHPLTIVYTSSYGQSFKKSISIVPTKSLM